MQYTRADGTIVVDFNRRARPFPVARQLFPLGAGPRAYGRARRQTTGRFVRGRDRTAGFYGRFNGPRGPRGLNRVVEQKFVDTALSTPASATIIVPTSTVTGWIDVIPQNDTQSGRIGRKCTIKSINVKGTVTKAAGVEPSDDFHMWIVQDTQTNGAQAATGTLFNAVSVTPGAALRNLENSSRFKILKHIHIENDSGASAGVAGTYSADDQQIDCYLKTNIVMEFDSTATTGAVATMRSNHVFLAYGSVHGASTFNGACRIKFTDL